MQPEVCSLRQLRRHNAADGETRGRGRAHEVERVAAAGRQRQADVLVRDVEDLHVGRGVLPALAVEKRGREHGGRLGARLVWRVARRRLAAEPDVVRGAQPRHVRDAALAVDLPNALRAVLEVRAALGPEVDAVDVKDAAPEEAARPRHLAQRQVPLAAHIEVGDAEQALLRQVRRRLVDGIVEAWDHCKCAPLVTRLLPELCCLRQAS
jgi:hypothetical protein